MEVQDALILLSVFRASYVGHLGHLLQRLEHHLHDLLVRPIDSSAHVERVRANKLRFELVYEYL